MAIVQDQEGYHSTKLPAPVITPPPPPEEKNNNTTKQNLPPRNLQSDETPQGSPSLLLLWWSSAWPPCSGRPPTLSAPGSESCRRGPSQNSKSRCVCPGLAKREDLLPGRLGRRLGPLAGRSGNEADQSAGQRARDDVDVDISWVWCVVCGCGCRHYACAPLLAILIY